MPETSRPTMSPIGTSVLWGLAILILGGCGNLTAGGFTAEAEVAVTAEAPDNGAAAAAPSFQRASALDEDDPEGEIDVEFTLFLESEDGTSVAIQDGPVRVRLDLEGREEVRLDRREIPAAAYNGLRMVFTELEIEVDAGLLIDGVPIVGEVDVELEDGTLTVTRPLDLDLSSGGTARLLVDLNTTDWLRTIDPDIRVVAESIVRDAIRVIIQ